MYQNNSGWGLKLPGLIRSTARTACRGVMADTDATQFSFAEMLLPGAAPMTVFHSGCSSIADFKGTVRAGVPVGVSVNHCSQVVIGQIPAALQTVPVFVDSGAFSEIRTGQAPDFGKVLDTYAWLAAQTNRPQALYCVTPDCVGDQYETLKRLRRWRGAVNDLVTAGVDMLLPLQRGPLKATQMWEAMCSELASDNFRASIPSNAAPLPTDELTEFLRAFQPSRLHLLGMGRHNARYQHRTTLIRHLVPEADLSCDSNRLRAWLGEVMTRERGQVLDEELANTCNQGAGVSTFTWDDTEIWADLTLEDLSANARQLLSQMLPNHTLTNETLHETLCQLPPQALWLMERDLARDQLEGHLEAHHEGSRIRTETIRSLAEKDSGKRPVNHRTTGR